MVLVCAGDEPANYILADQACALAQVNDDPFCITTDWDQICVDVYNCCAGAANGCTNAAACNFDPNACPDIALCTFSGCTDPAACNFNAAAGCDDGSCDLPNGCTDVAACNYNAAATCDDGSCAFAVAYYFDGDADGFGDGAPVMLCAAQSDYVLNNTDCDDGNAAVYPNAPSTEEGIDNDCNGLVDPDEEIPSDCLGDMNDDGNRDVADLLIVLGDFGCSGGCIADFNNDGNTNSVDFLAFSWVLRNSLPTIILNKPSAFCARLFTFSAHNMKNYYSILLGMLCIFLGFQASSQSYWSDTSLPFRTNQLINPSAYRGLQLNVQELETLVQDAPLASNVAARNSSKIISIPMPDGTTEHFSFSESVVMAPELQARYPFIRTYVGQGIENPTSILRFDITQKGFHGMILSEKGSVYIDPLSLTDTEFYMSYTREAFYETTTKVFNELPPIMPDGIDPDKYDKAIDIDKKKRRKRVFRPWG